MRRAFPRAEKKVSEGEGSRGSLGGKKEKRATRFERNERENGGVRATRGKCMHAVRRGVIYATINEQRDFA